MRRDYFTLEVRNVDWVENDDDPARPTVTVAFEGPTDPLRDRLTGEDGAYLDADDIDLTFRLQESLEAEEPRGVVSITHRVTGEFVLELNETADSVFEFVSAARRFGETDAGDGEYALEVDTGEQTVTFEKQTFLVYDDDGNLLRNHSLIPSGVEL